MSVVHLLSNVDALDSCLQTIEQDDALVLLSDGVFVISDKKLKKLAISISAIHEDAISRGVELMPHVKSVSYEDLVELVGTHHSSVSWT